MSRLDVIDPPPHNCERCWDTGVIGLAGSEHLPAVGQYPCWFCRPRDVEPPDEWSFLVPVLKDPTDDTSREVYADWLEDKGRADRAEFIRESVALARLVGDPNHPHFVDTKAGWMSEVDPFDHNPRHCHACLLASRWKGAHRPVRVRIARALAGVAGLPPDWTGAQTFTRRSRVCGVHCYKGFAGGLYLPLREFTTHARRLFLLAPVEHVVLIDRRPMGCRALHSADGSILGFGPLPGGPQMMWLGGRSDGATDFRPGSVLPIDLFWELEGGTLSDPDPGRLMPQRAYPGKWEAVDALSAACVKLVRKDLLQWLKDWEDANGVPG